MLLCRAYKQSSNDNSVCRRNVTQTASCSGVNTVECGTFGPMAASWTKRRFFHFATVLGLIEYRWASRFRLA